MFDTGTIQIAKIAGIPIRLHWSFILIFFWVGYNAWREDQSFEGFIFMQLYVLILFACVVMHEYGHALMARHYGHKTRDIVLTPIGGIARLESLSEQPKQEFWIAIAGPLVNVFIAVMIMIFLYLTGHRDLTSLSYRPGYESYFYDFLPLMMISNFLLAIFNLLPAFPMDGGRILRALLSFKWSRLRATLIAARIGQLFAIGFLIFAIYHGQWMLCLVSIFVLITAGNELKQVRWESVLDRKTARELVNPAYNRLQLTDSLDGAISSAEKGLEKNYLVFDGDRLVGYVPHGYLIFLLKNQSADRTMHQSMRIDHQVIGVDYPLKAIYHKLLSTGMPIVPISDGDVILGAIEESQIRKYIDIKLETN